MKGSGEQGAASGEPVRLLVLGAGGQVGRELLRAAAAAGVAAVGLDRAALDVTDRAAVARAVAAFARAGEAGVVVNAAAYTAVDRAEAEPDAARAVNADGAAFVARACAAAGLPLVHVSTDYVFSGTKGAPYVPADAPDPANVYGRTKADGEAAVRAALRRHVIVRTAWVFSTHGRNFLTTMHRLAGERERLAVVADQHGHPTPADGLADALVAIAQQAATGHTAWGTVHVAGAPLATWHDLAEAVVDAARALGPVRAQAVDAIPTSAYPTPAARPMRVALDLTAAETAFGVAPLDWRAGVQRAVRALGPLGDVA